MKEEEDPETSVTTPEFLSVGNWVIVRGRVSWRDHKL